MQGVGVNHLASFTEQKPAAQPPAEPVQTPVAQEPAPEPTPQPEPTPEPVPTPQAPVEKQENQEPAPAEPTVEKPKPIELTDEMVLEHLKKSRKAEINTIDDLFKTPEPVADPLEGLSDDALKFFKYNKETGRGYNDFQELNRDYSKMSPLDLARENAIKSTNGVLTKLNVDSYLEKKLGVDLSDSNNVDPLDLADLEAYASPYRLKQIEEQAKYNQPIERPEAANQRPTEEMITLEDGSVMPKAKYEEITNQRHAYLQAVQSATDNITSSSYQVEVDDNGTKKTYELSYDYSKEDKHKMVSYAQDIDNAITNLFGTDKGLDHAKLQEGMAWADDSFRGKAIKSIVHKALAEQAKDFMKLKNNYNFNTGKKIDTSNSNGRPLVIGNQNDFGVKFDFSNVKK